MSKDNDDDGDDISCGFNVRICYRARLTHAIASCDNGRLERPLLQRWWWCVVVGHSLIDERLWVNYIKDLCFLINQDFIAV